MTKDEFKAWFEGYAEGIESAPTAKQWKRIKDKVALITGTPTTYPVFIDRYLPYQKPYYYPYWGSASQCGNTAQAQLSVQPAPAQVWNGVAAFAALGRSEALGDA